MKFITRTTLGATVLAAWAGVAGVASVSLAALIAIKPGQRPRLIYRVHAGRGPRKDRHKGFTEADYARLLDAAHQQLGGPIAVVWDYVVRT